MYFALNSVLITSDTSCISGVSQEAAIPIACGNTVAMSARATPWRPSFHQLYSGMPSRGMAGAVWPSWLAFSSSVMFEMRSLTLTSAESVASLNFAKEGEPGSAPSAASEAIPVPMHRTTPTTPATLIFIHAPSFPETDRPLRDA